MKEIKLTKNYRCQKCGTMLISVKDDGYLSINSKSKDISTNTKKIKLTCKCTEKYEFIL